MHQEIHTHATQGKGNIPLFLGVVAAALLGRLLMSLLALLPYGGLLQLLPLAGAVLLFLWLYKRRLSAYRYTVYHKAPLPGELDEYGDPLRHPYPLGTLIFERMGRRPRLLESLAPGELIALLPPGEPLPEGVRPGPLLCCAGRKKAHHLIYRRKDKARALGLCPSEELAAILGEIIAAVNYCGGAE